jgi:hypothetical protein
MLSMADNKEKSSYMGQVARFYLAPELRSIATVFYLGVFGYITLYYVDSLFLAIRFLFYIVLGHTALTGTSYLFTGMAFVLTLVAPFFVAFYSIFLLHKIWHKPEWATLAKWSITIAIALGGIILIVLSDEAAQIAARQPSMQSFIEDANLTGRI